MIFLTQYTPAIPNFTLSIYNNQIIHRILVDLDLRDNRFVYLRNQIDPVNYAGLLIILNNICLCIDKVNNVDDFLKILHITFMFDDSSKQKLICDNKDFVKNLLHLAELVFKFIRSDINSLANAEVFRYINYGLNQLFDTIHADNTLFTNILTILQDPDLIALALQGISFKIDTSSKKLDKNRLRDQLISANIALIKSLKRIDYSLYEKYIRNGFYKSKILPETEIFSGTYLELSDLSLFSNPIKETTIFNEHIYIWDDAVKNEMLKAIFQACISESIGNPSHFNSRMITGSYSEKFHLLIEMVHAFPQDFTEFIDDLLKMDNILIELKEIIDNPLVNPYFIHAYWRAILSNLQNPSPKKTTYFDSFISYLFEFIDIPIIPEAREFLYQNDACLERFLLILEHFKEFNPSIQCFLTIF